MVTLIKYGALSGGEKYNVNQMWIDGLSTDSKPTTTVEGLYIPNGSVYTEVDTGKAYMFDKDNVTWYEVSIGGGGGGGFTPTDAQLAAMNSGIDSTKVQQISTNETNILSIQGYINDFGIVPINLFNKATITPQRFINNSNNGALQYNADYFTSDYIDIGEYVGDSMNMTYRFTAAFYDSDKTWISTAAGSATNISNTYSVAVPTGAKYIRVSAANTNLNVVQVGIGLTSLQYYAYSDKKITKMNIEKDRVLGLLIPQTNHIYVGTTRTYTSITAALNSITDANEYNKYIIHVDKGTYEETFHTKNYVDIVGENPYNTIINYTSNDESDWANRSTIYAESYTTLENLTITTTGAKYPLHCDGAYNVPYRVIVKNCILRHNGFTTISPAPAGTAVGLGLYHSQHIELIGCEIYGSDATGVADIYCHNSADTDEAHSKYRSLRIEHCLLGECTYGLRLQAIESNTMQDNDCWIIDITNNGTTPEYIQYSTKDSWHIRRFPNNQ